LRKDDGKHMILTQNNISIRIILDEPCILAVEPKITGEHIDDENREM
jgi:hypothetical protein